MRQLLQTIKIRLIGIAVLRIQINIPVDEIHTLGNEVYAATATAIRLYIVISCALPLRSFALYRSRGMWAELHWKRH